MTGAPTRDAFLGGRLTLLQPVGGHRAGTDAVLLAAAVPETASGLLFDLGAGVGAAGLAAARRAPGLAVRLVEIDGAVAALARATIEANGLAERAAVIEADIEGKPSALPAEEADIVLMNPPFYAPGTARPSPNAYRALAHGAREDTDEIWLRRAARLLRPGGRVVVIHRPDALARLLAATGRRFGDTAILPVLPRGGMAATRIVVCGIKGSRAPLRLLAPLVLHEADGRFTPDAEALHEGRAGLGWEAAGR
jgi:tRNA1(Val) A37 N6-methylase TrmN6